MMMVFAATQHEYEPDYVVTPGEILQDALEDVGMSQAELAKRTGLAPKTVNQIVKGHAPISTETAILLERVLGTKARFWSNLETIYRERLAKREQRAQLERHLDWLGAFPLSDLRKCGWIPSTKDRVQTLEALLDFFGVGSPTAWQQMWTAPEAALRHSTTARGSAEALATWLRIGELRASRVNCPPFHRERFTASLSEIRKLTTEKPSVFEAELERLCCVAGVIVCLVPHVSGAPVHGAARWLGSRGLIQLTLRYKTNDHFWFAFFHEAGHILKHGKKRIFIEDGGAQDESEHEANRFAADFLIPKANASELRGLHSKVQIQDFAQRVGVHPGIVVGRLQHEGIVPFRNCNDLKMRLEWSAHASGARERLHGRRMGG
jgi:addiction module HigA family antidote